MIGIAILGAGFMGQTHAGAWKALEGRVRVEVVASRTAERAAAVAATAGSGDVVADLQAAIADPRVDLVDICLPTPLHRTAAEAAFAAGKHVLLEKPLALTREDAEAILDAADRVRPHAAGRARAAALARVPAAARAGRRTARSAPSARHRRCGCRRRPTGPTGSSTRRSPAASRST